ncbi:UNVERIFIED_CONTAM: hypothetical protein Scaly_1889200 [Sesamum calycinum]|uniref:Uncharacterized protein n=1 Tax=Sesamum calycinum TaxID=2727403 RepID=A0AAW2NI97_9LAMI
MVMIRAERHLNMPPPAYHPESQSITVAVHFGGEHRNLPVANCIGGKVMKFDYMNALHMNKNNLDLFAEKCGISGEGLRYYIIKNGGFKLLLNDEDILEQVLEQLEKREFTVYIEFDPPKPQEVAVESDRVGKNATEKKKNKGKKKGRGNGKDKGKVIREEDDIEFLGEVSVDDVGNILPGGGVGEKHISETGGVGDMDEDDMDDADFLENDCGMDSVSGDDELYENFVDDVSAEMDSADETNSESSRDVVVSDNDMDEHRVSEDDENEPFSCLQSSGDV